MNLIEKNIDIIQSLCAKYRVLKLFAFGSVLTEKFNNNSDIDLIVDFENISVNEYADNYYDFKFSLQDAFHRNIDLLEDKAIKNPYLRQSIDSSKRLIYGK
jgi:predicted nucleotidyltransferase